MAAVLILTIAIGLPAGALVNVLADRVPVGSGASSPWRIPGRRVFVAIATPALVAATGLRFGTSSSLPAFVVFDVGLIALAIVDTEHHLLPKRIVYPCLAGVASLLIAATFAAGDPCRLAVAVAAGVVTWLVFAGLHLVQPSAMGFGDVRLAAVIGLALGWLDATLPAVAVLVGCVTGVAAWSALRVAGRVTRSTPLPFGTFLALGSFVAVLATSPAP